MNILVIIFGVVAAIALGLGAGKGSEKLFNLGFCATILPTILAFFIMKFTSALLFIGGMVILAVLGWIVALSARIGRVIKE